MSERSSEPRINSMDCTSFNERVFEGYSSPKEAFSSSGVFEILAVCLKQGILFLVELKVTA